MLTFCTTTKLQKLKSTNYKEKHSMIVCYTFKNDLRLHGFITYKYCNSFTNRLKLYIRPIVMLFQIYLFFAKLLNIS